MKIIIPTASTFEQIVGRQKLTDGQRYRLMTYVVQQPVDDGLLLYNTLTCSLVLLTLDEAATITEQRELIDRWFLVPEGHDDRKLCRQVHQMVAFLKPATKSVTFYTIFTTTGCNARCFYCYQKGTKPVTMTAETASKVVHYIAAHRGDEQVKLHWLGGEPLVNAKAIDHICTELREQGVPFYSFMPSNGYLFDADMVQRAKNLWQLQYVHITIDGKKQTYNRVKAYVNRDANAFERVLENIGLLTAADIDVHIRLNVDKYNIREMAGLVEQLYQHFGANEHLFIFSCGLYGERSPEDNAALFAQRMELKQQIAACGYYCKRGLRRDIKQNHCPADDDGSVVITPDGHLSKCQHFIERELFGHIDREERDETILCKFKERQSDIEACATCPYYPQCNLLVMCKKINICTPETQQEHLHDTMECMKNEYEIYLNNESHHPDSINV